MEECDCGWCGKCAEQLSSQRELEDRRGYGVDYYSDDTEDTEDKK